MKLEKVDDKTAYENLLVKYAELENKIAELNMKIDGLEEQNSYMFDTIALQEQQIEKMKCCYNCSKWYDGECEESPKSKTFFCADFKCDKWESE